MFTASFAHSSFLFFPLPLKLSRALLKVWPGSSNHLCYFEAREGLVQDTSSHPFPENSANLNPAYQICVEHVEQAHQLFTLNICHKQNLKFLQSQ